MLPCERGRARSDVRGVCVIYVSKWWARSVVFAALAPPVLALICLSVRAEQGSGGWMFAAGFWTCAAVVSAGLALLSRAPAEKCAFCEKPVADVKKLVAARAASICDECLPWGLAYLARNSAAYDAPGAWLRILMRALPPQCPRVVSDAVGAALLVADPTRETARWVAGAAHQARNPTLARTVFAQIPEPERTPWDWIGLGVALGDEGHYEEALAATERAAA